MKKFVKLLACVLALSLLVAFAINASNIAKPLTQKKVVNPDNLLQSDSIVWTGDYTKGIPEAGYPGSQTRTALGISSALRPNPREFFSRLSGFLWRRERPICCHPV